MGGDVPTALQAFDVVDRVIADPLRFKLRLGIGEDAYASLKMQKTLQKLWDVGGVAATGAGVAATPIVASTFFASTATGGFLSMIGLGTAAATPLGWIVAAGLASGGAYYGVTRLFRSYSGSLVDTIPKFINTPIDLLGATLFDLLGALAVRLAMIDGDFSEAERAVIVRHFVTDWGFDPSYVDRALTVIIAGADQQRLKNIARALANFQTVNPDCNPSATRAALLSFLREVGEADGLLDEREELAIDAIDTILREETELSFRTAGKRLAAWKRDVGAMARKVTGRTPHSPSALPR